MTQQTRGGARADSATEHVVVSKELSCAGWLGLDDWHTVTATPLKLNFAPTNPTTPINLIQFGSREGFLSPSRCCSRLLASAPGRFSSQNWVGSGRVGGLAMGAIETTVLVIVALLLGWGATEIACKPCMESGRAAINRSLDPDYDPDDEIANTPYVEAPRPVEKEEPVLPESPKKSYKVVEGEPSDI